METRPLDTKEFKGAEEGSISDKREYIKIQKIMNIY